MSKTNLTPPTGHSNPGHSNTASAAESAASELARADHTYLWHPFTQAREWEATEPLIVERAEGFDLIDTEGRRYLDGVSAIWCNVHGHGHPHIVEAMKRQLDRVSHSTMLGLSHRPGIELAERLAAITPEPLTRTFFSDAGSTAVEVALRTAFQYHRQTGAPERTRFLTLSGAYHGDTLGAVSLGFSEPFHTGYEPITFECHKLDPPFLRAPIRGIGAPTREALEAASTDALKELDRMLEEHGSTIAAIFIEPLVQGAAGIWPHPPSFVRGVREACDRHGCLLVCDEVATGFGRTGTMFAVEQASISPDILCLGKGLTAGYLPVAATVMTEAVFEAFTGKFSEFKTLFHGHTFGGNPLGCAAALANLEVFENESTVAGVADRAKHLAMLLETHIAPLAHTGPVRQTGMMVGFDILADPASGTSFPTDQRRAHRAVLAARRQGVVIRPLGDTMVLMPPLNLPEALLTRLVEVTATAIDEATRD